MYCRQTMSNSKISNEEAVSMSSADDFVALLGAGRWRDFDVAILEQKLPANLRETLLRAKAVAIQKALPKDLSLDDDQARIAASLSRTIRVTARAGSGKTRLLTGIAAYLLRTGQCKVDELLILTFNRDNAATLEGRLVSDAKIDSFPGARTFHSFALGIDQPTEAIITDDSQQALGRQLSILITDIADSLDPDELGSKLYKFFRRESAPALQAEPLKLDKSYYDYRRALMDVTLSGTLVKSRGEKFIGDFLFEFGIKHHYEVAHRTVNGIYRPDFTIYKPDGDFFIWEHWALNPDLGLKFSKGSWPYKQLVRYLALVEIKRRHWNERGIQLFESNASESRQRGLFEHACLRRLQRSLPGMRKLPQADLEAQLRPAQINRLSLLLAQAIQRAQKQGFDARTLNEHLSSYKADSEREQFFLELLAKVFPEYEKRLAEENKIDFDRVFNRAIKKLSGNPPARILTGKSSRIDLGKLKLCLVDEAQDLAPQYLASLTALKKLNPALKIILVGDDWQAINRFAGSNVELFCSADNGLGKYVAATLSTNYRSGHKIIEAGNRLMAGQGPPAVPKILHQGRIEMAYVDELWVEFRPEKPRHQQDKHFGACGFGLTAFIKALYQLSILDLTAGRTVAVLFRTNKRSGTPIPEIQKSFVTILGQLGWPRDRVAQWSEHQIFFSTVHKFKGAECDSVFIVDPFAGYFPLLNANSIELFRFFGETPVQAELDERRLFYVAITRAKDRLVFLTERRMEDESPYLESFRDLIEVISIPECTIVPDGVLP